MAESSNLRFGEDDVASRPISSCRHQRSRLRVETGSLMCLVIPTSDLARPPRDVCRSASCQDAREG